jgi:acyl carrier protein
MTPSTSLLELIAAGFTQVTGRPAPAIALDDDIAGLGLDSLAMLELVAWSEEQLGVRVPDEELTTVRTVGDLVTSFSARLDAGTP